jgi:anti-sigma B factor antagonist
MDIHVETVREIAVVTLSGQLNSNTSADFQDGVAPLAKPGQKILLDMSGVPYMSSAGLRVLLLLYRQISADQGQIVLAGVRDEIKDIMSMTGFLDFFTIFDDRAIALTYFDQYR